MLFYVNKRKQSNGDHEVHTWTCRHLPELRDRVYLGNFPSCKEAVLAAKRLGYDANGCYDCCKACHTS